jgi:hypothetical protein
MVGGKGEQNPVDQDNVLEVVNHALAVEKVHCGAQKIPIQGLGKA